MKGGKLLTEAALAQLFGDVEHLRMCLFRPRGWESDALEKRAAAGDLVRPVDGLYARRSYWAGLTALERLRHVVKTEGVVHPGWVFTHATAAAILGADVPRSLLWPIHYATGRSGGGKARELHVHHRFGSIESVRVDEVLVTAAARTVIDCARTYPFGEALAIADSVLHKSMATHDDLATCLRAAAGMRGARLARRVVETADSRPESGGESRVRALMIELGLPRPVLQGPVPDPEHPDHVYRVDFLFCPDGLAPVAFELDGMEKYENIAMTKGRDAVRVMALERQREAAITAHGIRVVRMGFAQAMNPTFLLKRLAAYGITPEPGRGERFRADA